MSKIVILTDGNTEVVVQNTSTQTAVNASTGKPAEYMSETGQVFAAATGKPIPAPGTGWWNNPQTGVGEVRETIALENGEHYPIAGGTVAKIVELSRSGTTANVLNILAEVDGKMRLRMAGKVSGELHGALSVSVGSKDSTTSVASAYGPLQAANFTTPVKAGEYVNIFSTLDGGDDVALLSIIPKA